MLNNIVPSQRKEIVEYELVFDDGHNNGFGFPCDDEGNLLPGSTDAAKENLAFCRAHPERFARFNQVMVYHREYTEPAHGTCSCGAEVFFQNQYCGACECSQCGKWYNLFGQELLPPEAW